MKITIYCSSSSFIHEDYFNATERLAHILVDNEIEVGFGGGSEGLMGKLADVFMEQGGAIQGIMPHFMKDIEWAHPKVRDFIFTETMAERKELLYKDADAVVALPGGTGTLEELFEIITLKRLGQFTKPIVILNTKHYYQPLIDMLKNCVSENFMNSKHSELWSFVPEPEEVLPTILNTPDLFLKTLSYSDLNQSNI